jgi:hypothetical protein
MSHQKPLLALPCAALCAALSFPAAAQEQSGTPQSGTPQSGMAQSGMVVVRDHQTGELRAPTAAESRALAPQGPSAGISAKAAAPAPALVTHPGGARQVRLGERSLVYSVVTRAPDGRLAEQCVQGEAAADKAVHAPASAQQKEHSHD